MTAASSKSYKIDSAWDENERTREARNGRIYVSTAPRKVWVCTLFMDLTDCGGELFDRKKDAVAYGEKWLAKASK